MSDLLSQILPPLIPTAGPWTTTPEQLYALYTCEYTGAITARTSLLNGFIEDPARRQYKFFDARSTVILDARSPNANSTLNSLGHSPVPLGQTLEVIREVVARAQSANPRLRRKPVIVSVTGTPSDVAQCHTLIHQHASRIATQLFMEVNLSCPNIHNHPPPAYESSALKDYLFALRQSRGLVSGGADAASLPSVPVGLKLPPYTYSTQFEVLRDALLDFASPTSTGATSTSMHDHAPTAGPGQASTLPISFLTSIDTLGCSLLLAPGEVRATSTGPHTSRYVAGISSESGTGLGGLGGAAIHALGLGNVHSLRRVLDESGNESLRRVKIIGVAGVQDLSGYQRMCAAGADIVGVGSAVLRDGEEVFERIGAEAETVLGSCAGTGTGTGAGANAGAAESNGGGFEGRFGSALEALRAP